LEYNLADYEDDNKPERVEYVDSILVARLKQMEDTVDVIEEYTQVVIFGIERLHNIQYAMTKKVISFVLNRICVDKESSC